MVTTQYELLWSPDSQLGEWSRHAMFKEWRYGLFFEHLLIITSVLRALLATKVPQLRHLYTTKPSTDLNDTETYPVTI